MEGGGATRAHTPRFNKNVNLGVFTRFECPFGGLGALLGVFTP